TILNGATPAIAATLAWTPVLFGRIVAIRRDLATVRETAARDEARMAAARAIQLGTLPFAADFRDVGVETAAVCRPAQEVGGDFFELFRLTDGRIFAAVGDVSGKGLEASLVTALSKSIAGALTDRTPGPLGAALSEVSREFLRQAPHDWLRGKGGFVTLIAATVDPETGEAEFVAAGADPAAVVGPDGAARPVPLPEVAPLGWNEDHAFETARLRLAPGDLVVMFTDGVTEAEAPDGDLFGKARADALLAAAAAGGGPEAAVAALEAAVADHQAGGEATDDTTILALAWTGRRLAGEGEGRHENGESPPAPAAEAAGG
ncbi:MAG: PP2C family protein-serine/threonine phosphatase, partial [Pseudomonadota bacterium]